MTGKPGHFGRLVIGDEQFEAEQAVLAEGKQTFGEAVTGEVSLGPPPAPEPEPPEAPSNLETFRKLLGAADVGERDGLLAAELAREGGPRKTALTLLRDAEEAAGDAARPATLVQIDQALGGLDS